CIFFFFSRRRRHTMFSSDWSSDVCSSDLLNPYRAHHVSGKEVTEHSLVNKMPESVVHLAEGYWWFDPSLQSTQDHSSAVVKDIVKRYNIDGVHFDDYFYPYESYNKGADFPDDESWKK